MGALKSRIDDAKRTRTASTRRLFAPAGQSTQMIVGATPSTDRHVLSSAHALYDRYALRRVYYSAYSPIPFSDPTLPAKPAPLVREHRLYQADWLLRFYGFDVDEVVPDDVPDLPLDLDPKLAWALRHPERFPVDLMRAPRELLLRVPGLGVRTADQIVEARRHVAVTTSALARMRVSLRKVGPFVLTADRNRAPARLLDRLDLRRLVSPPRQLSLFGGNGTPS